MRRLLLPALLATMLVFPLPIARAQEDDEGGEYQFTLEEAFRAPEKKKAAAAAAAAPGISGSAEEIPQPRKAPELKKFDIKNLDAADRRNLQILEQIRPQVEAVFKKHPNPETAEAMKKTRRYAYYLKKRATGYPAEPEVDAELDLFIKSRIKKVRVIER